MTRPRILLGWLAVLATAGCAEGSALAPASPEASRIAGLWWLLFVLGTAVYVLVLALLAVPLWRSRRATGPTGGDADAGVDAGPDAETDAPVRRRLVVLVGIALPVAVILAVVVAGSVVGRGVAPRAAPTGTDEVVVEVVGAQFWWRVTYPGHGVVTANEIHVPTGTHVRLRLWSEDVIHSFWVPPLHGKIDLRPGAVTELSFTVDHPGEHAGRCAEFCGLAHAQMGLLVVAEDPDDFASWLEQQAADAAAPAGDAAERGRERFAASCAACHEVRGHTGPADLGPDLTHVASRATLAAGTIPNLPDRLRTWILSPHAVKPGVAMPPTDLDRQELDELVAYLEGLR